MKLAFISAILVVLLGCSTEHDHQQTAAPPPQPVADTSSGTPIPAEPTAEVAPSPTISVPAIAGKSPSQVAAVLGEPSSRETIRNDGRPLTKRYYRGGDIEIVYVDGKADWITVYGQGQLPFAPSVLAALDLPGTSPTFFNPAGVIRWETIPGIKSVSVFPSGDGRAHYVYVLVNTSP